MNFLLDTDTCSAHLKRPTGLMHRFVQYAGGLCISTVALGELYTWAYSNRCRCVIRGKRVGALRKGAADPARNKATKHGSEERHLQDLKDSSTMPPRFARRPHGCNHG